MHCVCLLQASLLPSLLSLSKFAKNNSLGSFNSHNLADLSTLPSVPGDGVSPEMDGSNVKGHEGQGTGAGLLGSAPGHAVTSPTGGAEPDWGQQRHARDAGPSGRGSEQDGGKNEDSEQYLQGMFWKQLQQQRQQQQQQQKREHGLGEDASQQQPRRENGFQDATQPDLRNPGHRESAVAHFTQLQRGRTPPDSPYHEPNQARGRPASGANRDPTGSRPGSPYHEPAVGSPRHNPGQPQGKGRTSKFLSELAQAIEPSVKGKDLR